MTAGKSAINLSINQEITRSIKGFIATNPRRGRKNVSELTENLWISFLRRKGVKLPALLKNGKATK